MALKTNSKQAKENIKKWIVNGFHCSDFENWNKCSVDDYKTICTIILSTFKAEKNHDNRYNAGRISLYDLFVDWAQGLPDTLKTEDYFLYSACDLLGGWLEESESEKARFSETQAEQTITRLLWRELNANGQILPFEELKTLEEVKSL